MPFKDEDRRRRYNREYARARRAGMGTRKTSNPDTLTAEDFRTAESLRDLLSDALAEVWRSDTDPLSKARTLAYVAGVQLRAVEVADIEARIVSLEQQQFQGGVQNGHSGA